MIRNCACVTLCMLILLAACGNKKQSTPETPLVHSYRLIDDNRVDEAIAFLTDALQDLDSRSGEDIDASSEATQLRVTLASAYAKKAGISMREIAKSIELGRRISEIKLIELPVSEKNREQSNGLKLISEFLLTQLRYTQTISIIPQVESQNLGFLRQSTRILSTTPNLRPEDLIYSALLKIILTRSILGSQDLASIFPKLTAENGQCIAKLNNFSDYLTRASKTLLSGIEDLEKAMPEKKNELQHNSQVISGFVTALVTVNMGFVVALEADWQSYLHLSYQLGLSAQEKTCEPHVQPAH